MYVEYDSAADTNLDINTVHFVDDLSILYPVDGMMRSCCILLDIKIDRIILVLDPLFTLHVDIPLVEYDRDSVLENLIDEVSIQLGDKLQLKYEISMEEFKTHIN